ncbi:MAG: sigma-70 family RNA polymerase sigma factor [Bacteroidota bacterium]
MSKDTFIALVQQHQGLINKILFLYADNAEDRKDLRQEILTEAWRSFGKFRGEAKFSTWLYRVGVNVALSFLRKNPKTHGDFGPEKASAGHGEEELLQQVLQVLNPVEKSLILLLLEGYDQQEISDILGISPGNTRVKIHRTREKLRTYGIDRFVE